MTVHQEHHIVEGEGGFYCQTCTDQAAIEADLHNTITRLEGAIKRVVSAWGNIRQHEWIVNDFYVALDALAREIGRDSNGSSSKTDDIEAV